MCARVTLRGGIEKVKEEFGISSAEAPDFKQGYNISPGTDVLAVVRNGESRLSLFRWGLIPSWAREAAIGNKLINARAETLAEKPAFKDAFRKRRCLMVVDGFYEWHREKGRSIPFFISLKSGQPFGLAGLYETWNDPDGGDIETCTVITTEANEIVAPIHSRMPAIIPVQNRDLWLDPGTRDMAALGQMLKPYDPGEMDAYRVSPYVNYASNDSPECIAPVKGGDP
jgi:putative SOS response-associated peptidase YedK